MEFIRPFILLASLCALSACGTRINSLESLARATTGAGGVPSTITSLTLTGGTPTNEWPLNLAWGASIGAYSQYCLLENSTDRTICVWHAGLVPAEYEDSAADGPFALTAYLKNDYGISDPIVSNSITIDRTPPDLASAAVTNASPTNSTTLGLSFGVVSEPYASYCVSVNSTDLSACAWTAGALPASTTIAAGDGSKTLRFWLKDAAGNVSNPVAASAVNLDQTLPVLTLTSLTGGQALVGGQSASITWTGSDLYPGATPIKLEYSSDSGANWTTIQSAIANSGSYAWTIPSVTSVAYRVRVSFTDQAGNVRTSDSASDFSINSSSPSVAVTAPNGGEIWKGGSSHAITWTASGLPAGGPTAVSAKIEYSLNNGANWTTEAAAAPNTGTYAWTLPAATDSTQALVRVSVTDSFGIVTSDISNANFRIDSTVPTLALTSLTGGQTVGGGAATAINWTGSDANPGTTPIKLEYSSDSGANWTLIQDNVANSGAYSWTTPAVTSTTYRVQVTFTDAVGLTKTVASTSDFSINASSPIVSVTSPNGGEIWKGGSAHDVTWSASGLPAGGGATEEAKLEYSLDDGGSWTTIVASTPNDGTYSWTVPAATDSIQALVRVSVTDSFSSVTSGVSNANFAIDSTNPSVTLTSLLGTDVITGGAPYDITWTATDTNLEAAPISIEVSSDGGSSYTSLASGLANSGTYSWSVPAVDSATYRIKVIASDEAGNSGEDASSSNFSIGYVPASITIVSGNNQTHAVGAALGADFVAVVKDASGRVIDDVAIDWNVVTGGGTLAAATDTTNASGLTSNQLTLTSSPGSNSVKATLHDYPTLSVSFSATGVPAAIDHFTFASVPTTVVASDEFTFTVTAMDAYENTITDYAGTVTFTSSDAYAILPVNYTFVGADNGETNPVITFRTAGSKTITVTQTAGGAPASTTAAITVTGTPSLAWNITALDFGTLLVGTDSYTQDVYFQNSGPAVATGCAAATLEGTNPGDFTIVSDACATSDSLPDASCKVQVKASPSAGGARSAKLRRVCAVGGTVDADLTAVGSTNYATQIALGRIHTCAVLNDHSVRCWGEGLNCQLGEASSTSGCHYQILPVATYTTISASQVAAGNAHSCALLTDGKVNCWGSNAEGQIGDATTTNRSKPTLVSGITTATQIAVNAKFTCAVLDDGTAKCWGDNSSGQLGNGNTTDQSSPVAVSGLTGASMIALGGTNFACAALTGGGVKCWGLGTSGQIGDGGGVSRSAPTSVSGISTASQVVAGNTHACTLLSSGKVSCWGLNAYGQLGDGTTTTRTSPVVVQASAGVDLTGVTELFASYDSTCALLSDATVKCWGGNTYGQLGDGTTLPHSYPTAVVGLSDVKKLALGSIGQHNCAVLNDNRAKCWGNNGIGQVGSGLANIEDVPAEIPSFDSVVDIANGFTHTCAVRSDEKAYCWGSNANAQLGDASIDGLQPVPNEVSGLSNVAQVSVGDLHSCARLSTGAIWCWGTNSNGQLGDGTTTLRAAPVQVSGITDATDLVAGQRFNCAVVSGGAVKCWGAGASGQMGNGTTTTTNKSPVAVSGISNAVRLSAGGSHACAVLSTGAMKCWGENANGQLGNASTTPSSSPVSVSGISTAVSTTANNRTTCARLSDKTMKCWGYNSSYYVVGDGTTTQRTTPVAVTSLSNVAANGAGGYHNCAAKTDGSVKCWGIGGLGRMGDGVSVTRSTKVTPIGLPSIARFSTGGGSNSYHMCAVGSVDGKVYCWGYNDASQCGQAPNLSIQTVNGL